MNIFAKQSYLLCGPDTEPWGKNPHRNLKVKRGYKTTSFEDLKYPHPWIDFYEQKVAEVFKLGVLESQFLSCFTAKAQPNFFKSW